MNFFDFYTARHRHAVVHGLGVVVPIVHNNLGLLAVIEQNLANVLAAKRGEVVVPRASWLPSVLFGRAERTPQVVRRAGEREDLDGSHGPFIPPRLVVDARDGRAIEARRLGPAERVATAGA